MLSVGRMKNACIREAAEDYLKRIKRYAKIRTVDIKDASGLPVKNAVKKEAEEILKAVERHDFKVALCSSGRQMTSEGMAGFISEKMMTSAKGISFITGGPYGLANDVYDACGLKLSLSMMTFPHEMARLILLEQVYRAFTIIKGEPYSH
mgnify:CR=1 FL=1